MRYLLANLYDFDPAVDALPRGQMQAVDRYILARYAQLAARIVRAYGAYDYGTIFQALNAFATVDLSAFYADVSKDRLYTLAARSRERRSAQTAMFLMADGLTRLVAPILSFTADELWLRLPGRRDPSVHMALFPDMSDLEPWMDADLVATWDRLGVLRDRVLTEIEPLRKDKQIGSSLQARVILAGTAAERAWLEPHLAELPMLFIVSEVELKTMPAGTEIPGEPMPRIEIARAGGTKCERCWRYVPSISSDPEWAGLCPRCQDALAEPARG
jgi:isoleucyl-tRNA synthetase